MSDVGPHEANAQKVVAPLRRWKARNFGFLTSQEANHLNQVMIGILRRAKDRDRDARLETNK